MKKSQVNKLLIKETNRIKHIIRYVCLCLIFSIFSLASLYLFIINNKPKYINYSEKSNLDYKVFLKENEFFKENYLPANKEYISSLISYVEAVFNYDLKLEKPNALYKYSYYIESNVRVKEKTTGNDIYSSKEKIKEGNFSNKDNSFEINEIVQIDYNKYNNLIKKFVNIYGLDNTISTLDVNMYVSVLGDCDNKINDNKSVITLSIPLTTNTVGIDMTYDLVNQNNEKILDCTKDSNIKYIYLIITSILIIVDIIIITRLINYILKTRKAETIYERELKKILNNYKSYIQKINNYFDLDGYQLLKVDTFLDMLEIRDTIQEPILMVSNNTNTGVYFFIPSKTKILYSYGLKVEDFKQNLDDDNDEE